MKTGIEIDPTKLVDGFPPFCPLEEPKGGAVFNIGSQSAGGDIHNPGSE